MIIYGTVIDKKWGVVFAESEDGEIFVINPLADFYDVGGEILLTDKDVRAIQYYDEHTNSIEYALRGD